MESMGAMSFGGESTPWSGIPANEIPVALSLTEMSFITSNFAIFVDQINIYSSGLSIRFECRFRSRQGPVNAPVEGFMEIIQGESPSLFRAGLKYYDEFVADTLKNLNTPPDHILRESSPVITVHEMKSRGAAYSFGYWVSPLPIGGDSFLFAEWLAQGFDYHEWPIPAAAIIEAKQGVRTLWDDSQR